MATKQNLKKKLNSRKTAVMKAKPQNKSAKKKSAKKKAFPKKAMVNTKARAKKKSPGKSTRAPEKRIRGKSQDVDTVEFTPAGTAARSAGQSGSLQGLSDIEAADSESVDELIEEGNAFEAEVVQGVEDAPDPDQAEVHTHEVPEDDVPGEYDDK
jgi:hypothetical protein